MKRMSFLHHSISPTYDSNSDLPRSLFNASQMAASLSLNLQATAASTPHGSFGLETYEDI